MEVDEGLIIYRQDKIESCFQHHCNLMQSACMSLKSIIVRSLYLKAAVENNEHDSDIDLIACEQILPFHCQERAIKELVRGKVLARSSLALLASLLASYGFTD